MKKIVLVEVLLLALIMMTYAFFINGLVQPRKEVKTIRNKQQLSFSVPSIELAAIEQAGFNREWYSQARQQLQQTTFSIQKKNEVFTGQNMDAGLVFNCKGNQLLMMPLLEGGELTELHLTSINRGNDEIKLNGKQEQESLKDNKLQLGLEHVTIEYVNSTEGLRQNFIIAKKPEGESPLQLILSNKSPYQLKCEDAKSIHFKNAQEETVFTYSDLKVWDNQNKIIPAHMEVNNNQIALVVNDKDAIYPLTVDPIWTTVGTQLDGHFGYSIANGDLNGDGIDDLITTTAVMDVTCLQNPGITLPDAGAIHVFYGVANGMMSPTPNWTAYGDQIGSGIAGVESISAADINGDGIKDLVVGNRFYDKNQAQCATSSNHSGAVFIWLGGPSGLSQGNNLVDMWSAEYKIGADQPGAKFGSMVSTGDYNSDGKFDILVGSPHWDKNNLINPNENYGKVYLYYGDDIVNSPNPLLDAESDASWSIEGGAIGERLGSGLISPGDVNGDQISDFLVVADGYSVATNNSKGAAFLWLGSSTKLGGVNIPLLNVIPNWKVHTEFGGLQRNIGHNFHTHTNGDFNNDGYNDILIQDHNYNQGNGAIYVWYGNNSIGSSNIWESTDSPDWWIHHKPNYHNNPNPSHLGFRCVIKDLNDDGYDELISMASEENFNDGVIYVWNGDANGLGNPNRSPDWSYSPHPNAGGQSGGGLAAGDFNGDLENELAIGTNGLNNGFGELRLVKPEERKSLYVGDFNEILGDENAENSLIAYAHNNGYGRLYLFNMHHMLPPISTPYSVSGLQSCGYGQYQDRTDALKGFLVKAHTYSASNGLALEVFSAVASKNDIDSRLMPFEAYYYPTNALAYFDGYVTEIEFWNSDPNTGLRNCAEWEKYEEVIKAVRNTPSYHQYRPKAMHSYLGKYLENIIDNPTLANPLCTSQFNNSATVTKQYLYETIIQYNDMVYIEAYRKDPTAPNTTSSHNYHETFRYLKDVLVEFAHYTHQLNRPATKIGFILNSDCEVSGGWLSSGGTVDQAQDVFKGNYKDFMSIFSPYASSIKIIEPAVFKYKSLINSAFCNQGRSEEPNLQMAFDGVDDYVSICRSTNGSTGLTDRLSNATAFTIEGWFNVDAQIGSNPEKVIFSIDNGTDAFQLGYSYQADYYYLKTFAHLDHSGKPIRIQISNIGSSLNNCKHIAVTYINNSFTFFENGTQFGTLQLGPLPPLGPLIKPIPIANKTWFGGSPTVHTNGPQYFHGTIDEFRIWTYARSEEQIRTAKDLPIDHETVNQGISTTLLAYWKFDELPGSQLLIDQTGEWRYRGILGGTNVADINDPVAGASSTCYQNNENVAILFDGIDDYLHAKIGSPAPPATPINSTIECWFNADQNNTNPPMTILSNMNNSNPTGLGFRLFYNPTSTSIDFECPSLGITSANPIRTPIVPGMCNHYAITLETPPTLPGQPTSTNVSVYLNGVLLTITPIPLNAITANDFFTSTQDLYVGAEDNTPLGGLASTVSHFKGLLDEIRIYKYAATPLQIHDNWNKKIEFGLSHFHAYWHLDDYLWSKTGLNINNAGDDNSFYGKDIAVKGNPLPVASCTPIDVNSSSFTSATILDGQTQTQKGSINKTIANSGSLSSMQGTTYTTIYPNPVASQLFVSGALNNAYMVYDICGKLAMQGQLTDNKLDVSGLKSGLYFIQFKNNSNGVQQFKFVKE